MELGILAKTLLPLDCLGLLTNENECGIDKSIGGEF
jgi:hypothetical protein